DLIGANRATLMHALPSAMQLADQTIRARVVGQDDMFGLLDDGAAGPAVTLSSEVLPDWSRRVRLDGERDTLGLYLTGHPFEEFEHEVRPIISGRIADITGDRPRTRAVHAWCRPAAERQRRLPAVPRQAGDGRGHGVRSRQAR